MRFLTPKMLGVAVGLVLVMPAAAAHKSTGTAAIPTTAVGYTSQAALDAALERYPARIVRRIPALKTVEVRPVGDAAAFARGVSKLPGIAFVERTSARVSHAEPALAALPTGVAYQWQFAATRLNAVPEAVSRAAANVTIAVIDTGADLTAPDLAAKAPRAYSIATQSSDVRDANGHGTFVASLAAGSTTNNEGIAGAGGDAKLLIVQAGRNSGSFTDVEEAAAIVYAVDQGAKIINLSFGGPDTSRTEQRAVDYAVGKGALLVAAVGNEFNKGNPVEYPAALLQPVGSNGAGGRGLAVGASTAAGARAAFSNTGSHLSLVAPGERVLGALSSFASATAYPRFTLPGSVAGLYGYASGTSFAVPQVVGAAALVWAANPSLNAQGVAQILEETASNRGTWNAETGFGVLDAAAAVAKAAGTTATPSTPPSLRDLRLDAIKQGRKVHLRWDGDGVAAFRLTVRTNGSERVLLAQTTSKAATYRVTPGYTYVFQVAGLDATGAPTKTSSLTVRVKR